jgi:hypothetical protein
LICFRKKANIIKASTKKTVLEEHAIDAESNIFYDALVHLGTPGQNQTSKPVRVVGYKIGRTKYYIATDRHDLTAEQVYISSDGQLRRSSNGGKSI